MPSSVGVTVVKLQAGEELSKKKRMSVIWWSINILRITNGNISVYSNDLERAIK